MTDEIELIIEGEGVSLASMRMSELLVVFGRLERAVLAMIEFRGVKLEDDEAPLPMRGISEGSFALSVEPNPKTLEPLREIAHAFYASETQRLPSSVRAELVSMRTELSKAGHVLKVRGAVMPGEFAIDEGTFIAEDVEFVSEAAVYGRCRRVNVGRKDARLYLEGRGTGSVQLEGLKKTSMQTLLECMGKDLDQVFRVEGRGTWDPADLRYKKIRVASIEPVELDPGALFDALHDAANGAFDEIDVEEWMDETRGRGQS